MFCYDRFLVSFLTVHNLTNFSLQALLTNQQSYPVQLALGSEAGHCAPTNMLDTGLFFCVVSPTVLGRASKDPSATIVITRSLATAKCGRPLSSV